MRKMFLAALLFIASSAAFAQNGIGKTTFKPTIGINLANITDGGPSDIRPGISVGAEFETGITDVLGISYGALYSMQGAKNTEDGISYTMKLDYINIPILLNGYIAKGFAVKVGLQPGFCINKSATAKVGGQSVSGSIEDDGFKTFDLSLPVGLSYEINNIVFDGRYNFGLTKFYENASPKHSVFTISIGYKFALK